MKVKMELMKMKMKIDIIKMKLSMELVKMKMMMGLILLLGLNVLFPFWQRDSPLPHLSSSDKVS